MGWSMEIEGIKDVIQDLNKDVYTDVFVRTVNDIVPSIAVETMRATKKEWNLGSERYKIPDTGKYAKPHTWYFSRKFDRKTNKRTGIVKFHPAPRIGNKTATIVVKGSAIPLSLFETNPDYSFENLHSNNPKPVRYKIKKGKVKTLDKGFRAKMKSGHTGIFYRTKRKNSKGKYIIMEDHSITPTTMFDRVGIDEIAQSVWAKKSLLRFEHYLRRYQKGYR